MTSQKSVFTKDVVVQYCTKLSTRLNDIELELQKETIEKAVHGGMIGAPEVLELGRMFILLHKGKKVLDVGTFTGASALAWAFALPEDGQVISMDVNHDNLNKIGLPIIEKRPDLRKKIDFRLGSALSTLDSLIADGQSGTFDFAFIDADKGNYPHYYEKCVQLLKPGGVILVDNALRHGSVVDPQNEDSKQIDIMNRAAAADNRTMNSLINMADGVHIIFKKP